MSSLEAFYLVCAGLSDEKSFALHSKKLDLG
jgi:hypothetical protein